MTEETGHETGEVLVVGDAIVDFVFGEVERMPEPGEEVEAGRYELRHGGSGGYASMGLGALGVDVRVATLVGTDPLSDQWLDFVGAQGVDTAAVERVPDETVSSAAAILTDTDRAFVTYRGAAAGDRVLAPDVGDAGALLVTGFSQAPYLWGDEMVAFIRAVGETDVPVFLDMNWAPADWQGAFDAVVGAIDYLLVNEREACGLAGTDAVPAAGRKLVERGVGTCVVKTGVDGCTIVDESGVETVATDHRTVVDANGAGDFFNAGFVAGLVAGESARDAGQLGNRCGGAAVETFAIDDKLAGVAAIADEG